MKSLLHIVYLVLILSLAPYAFSASAPLEIADIRLGTNIDSYPDFEYTNYLKEIVVVDWHGFRKGVISYGMCHSPGTIIRIDMKYEDPSKAFFNDLLKRYKTAFGAPNEWKGDSFGIKHIWKWKFVDDSGNTVNLILQHNLQDANENIGNMLKLSYPEMLEHERLCFNRMCEETTTDEQKQRKERLKETGWNFLIPR